jgi:hypothetical protein
MYNRKNLWSKFRIIGILLIGLPLASFAQSILKQGTWHRIAIASSGFYRIDQAWLRKHNISGDPQNIGLYTSAPGMLSQDPAKAPTNNLFAVPVVLEGNGQLLFWGESPNQLQFDAKSASWNQETNTYSDSSYYYLRVDDPKPVRMTTLRPPKGVGNPVNFAHTLSRYEPEKYNLIQSGRTWLGHAFFGTGNLVLQYALKDVLDGTTAELKARFYAGGTTPSKFSLTIPGNSPISIDIPAISGNRYDQKAFFTDVKQPIKVNSSGPNWNWNIAYQTTSGTGYLDYIQFAYKRKFNANTDLPLYLFTNSRDTTANVQIQNLQATSLVWLKNGQNEWQQIQTPGAEMEIRYSPGSQLALGNSSTASYPIWRERISNQDLLAQDPKLQLIIITSPPLRAAAEKLAIFKSNIQKIPTQTVTTAQIYHEFSGGKQDVSAIRNYLKALASRTTLRYVLILGDASIDYKGKSAVASTLEKNSYVPTYQSLESTQPLISYSSDDYFGIIDSQAGDWENTQPNLQLAIGRIPAKNPIEANMFIQKLIDYQSKPSPATRRPYRFSWVADDGDFSIHMQDAEDFSAYMQAGKFAFDYQKTYLDQFPMEVSNGQYTSSAAKKQVLSLFTQDADFIHFIGHGSESGWTDEKILTNNDIIGLKNSQHLPILLTATCQFGRFDDPNQLSGGEIALLSPQGGSIALISTTRPVFQSSNYIFGKAFYKYVSANMKSSNYRLGDLFRDTKNDSKTGVINRNISLLGDPSSPLPWQSNALTIAPDGPNYLVKSESETEGPLTAYYYAANTGAKTLGTKGAAFSYELPGKLIGKSTHVLKQGVSTISANSLPSLKGKMEMKLIGQAKSGIAISGHQLVQRKQMELTDTKPPVIQITFPDEPIQGVFSANPTCEITISDDQGLQWHGPKNEIAFLTLNDTLQIPMLPYWEPSLDKPNQGSLRYMFTNLKAGSHDLRVNCWDSNNNASLQSFKFTVGENASTTQRWKLYPNPALEKMTFRTQLNRVWSSDRYELELFNLVGERIFEQTGDLIQMSNREAGFEFSVNTLGIGGMGFVKINVLDSQGKIIETVKSKILTLK